MIVRLNIYSNFIPLPQYRVPEACAYTFKVLHATQCWIAGTKNKKLNFFFDVSGLESLQKGWHWKESLPPDYFFGWHFWRSPNTKVETKMMRRSMFWEAQNGGGNAIPPEGRKKGYRFVQLCLEPWQSKCNCTRTFNFTEQNSLFCFNVFYLLGVFFLYMYSTLKQLVRLLKSGKI